MSRVELLVLRAGDERVLREWTRASSIPAGLAQRARILLLAAEGQSNTEIGRLVGVSLPTVRLWRGRYGAGGVEGLGDLHRSGRPAIHDEMSIIAVTLEPPPDTLGVT
ncbi:MAG TPA: helix-turn-helix domain-containing protein, partial [Candidatus Limnocylindrales bacterium]